MNSSALAIGLGGALSGFVGAALVLFFLSPTSEPNQASAAPGPAAKIQIGELTPRGEQARAAMLADGDAATLAELNRRIELLESDLASLRNERARQAVATPASATEMPTPEAVAEIQREAIVQVLEDQRKAEQEKRDEERKERQRQMADDMAARAAKELGLGAGDERRLAEFIVTAADKRDEMFRAVREGGSFDRDSFRETFEGYRTWAEGELNGAFGANVGGQIAEWQRKQRDGWGGFGGFGGGPPSGGSGGGGSDQGRGRGGRGGR